MSQDRQKHETSMENCLPIRSEDEAERDKETLTDECLIQIKDEEKGQCPKH